MGNFIIWAVLLIVLGLLAVPSLILSKKPDAKALFDKIAPFQGGIGIVFFAMGIWRVIVLLLNMEIISFLPMLWFTLFADFLIMAVLGFILGYSLIQKYALSNNEATAEKGEKVLKKLLPLQGTLGLISIALGIWTIIYYFIIRSQFTF